jgi:hypothetical protein
MGSLLRAARFAPSLTSPAEAIAWLTVVPASSPSSFLTVIPANAGIQ